MFVTFMWSTWWPVPLDDHAGPTKRRREQRSRQFLRHERLPVAMVLSVKKHHTSRGVRGRTGPGGEEYATQCSAKFRKTLLPASCSHQVLPADGRRGWWTGSWGASGMAASDTSTSWRSMPQCCKWLMRWTILLAPLVLQEQAIVPAGVSHDSPRTPNVHI